MLRSLLPSAVALTTACSGTIAGDSVESLTLIANELVTNAAKYAFQGRETGEIVLGYRQERAGWRLWVHDNGNGLPVNHGNPSQSFGHQFVLMLAARLNAEINYSSAGGARAEVVCGIRA
jgi:two-component system, sensor histidine kinase PdtaS